MVVGALTANSVPARGVAQGNGDGACAEPYPAHDEERRSSPRLRRRSSRQASKSASGGRAISMSNAEPNNRCSSPGSITGTRRGGAGEAAPRQLRGGGIVAPAQHHRTGPGQKGDVLGRRHPARSGEVVEVLASMSRSKGPPTRSGRSGAVRSASTNWHRSATSACTTRFWALRSPLVLWGG
jgi:hypothetical protein